MTVVLSEHAQELLDAALARRPGRAPAEILETALAALMERDLPGQSMTPAEAVADIRELRRGLSLGGLRIKDLINEGRKY